MSLHKGKLRRALSILFITSHIEKVPIFFTSKFLWKVADLNLPFQDEMIKEKTCMA